MRALRDLAEHLEKNTRLDVPITIDTTALGAPALRVPASQYTIWRDTARVVGDEHVTLSELEKGTHRIVVAVQLGETVFGVETSTTGLTANAFRAQVGYTQPLPKAV